MATADDGWSLVENPETVTLRTKTGDLSTDVTPVTVQYAKRREPGESGAEGLLVGQAVFHLWVAKLGGAVPRPDHEIVDGAGVVWHVEEAKLLSLGQRYRCVCRRPR